MGGDGLGGSRRGTAHTDEPEDHEQEREDCEEDEDARLLHDYREEMRTGQENRCSGDEQSETHAPEMTRKCLGASHRRAKKHADIAGGSE